MSSSNKKTTPKPSTAMESEQLIGVIVSRSLCTSSPSIVREEITGENSKTSPLVQHEASQGTKELPSQSAPANTVKENTDKCAICYGPANHRCARCADGVGMYGKKSPTFYCSQECQRMHWTVHKLECKVAIDRNELYKIGSLLQWAFYAGRKVMWQDDVGRVKKIEQTSEDNKPKLLVWRDKAKISSRLAFPAFPDSLFDEERDKHAVLAREAPGVSLMSGLMGQLLKASKSKTEIQEVAIRPRACRFARFVSRIAVSANEKSLSWLFRVTLGDGSAFAVDVCNAQYTVNTLDDSGCGVFPWEPYMERLSVSHGDLVYRQTFGTCFSRRDNARMTGNARDVKAGVLTSEDKQCLAEFMVTKAGESSYRTMPPTLTLEKIMRLPSSEYDGGLNTFKKCHNDCLDLVRKMLGSGGAQWMILGRFQGSPWSGPPGP